MMIHTHMHAYIETSTKKYTLDSHAYMRPCISTPIYKAAKNYYRIA